MIVKKCYNICQRHFTKKILKSGNCYTHIDMYTYAHTHTCIHMHIHVNTHTRISSSLQLFNSQYSTPPRFPCILVEVYGNSGPMFYKGKSITPCISRPSLKHLPGHSCCLSSQLTQKDKDSELEKKEGCKDTKYPMPLSEDISLRRHWAKLTLLWTLY